jgi:hypothetical protein
MIDEISAVDRPAQAHARMAIMKRADPDSSPLDGMSSEEIEALAKAVEARLYDEAFIGKREFSAEQRREDAKSGAAMPDGSFPISNAGDLANAMRLAGHAKDPAKARAHIKARAKALGLADKLSDAYKSEGGLIAKLKEFLKTVAPGNGAEDEDTEPQMSTAVKKALGLADSATEEEVLKVVTKLAKTELSDKDKEIAKLALENEILKADMSDDEKKHHDALPDDAARKAFRTLPKDDRAKLVKKAEPEVSPELKKVQDENADLKKRLEAVETDREIAKFAKRAEDMGLPATQGEVLRKAVAGAKDPAAVEAIIKMLSDNIALANEGGVFKEFGSAQGKTGDALDQLNAKAEELRKKDPKLTSEQAFVKVYADPANAKLVREERNANRPRAN